MITGKNISKNKSEKKIISNETNFETRYGNKEINLIPTLIFIIHHKTSKIEQDFKSNGLQNVYDKSKLPKVLILTYFRSGLSFLRHLLSANSDTFYSFEPFCYIFDEFRKHEIENDETINLINPKLRCEYKK
jgi:hypothetical protein